MHVSAYEGGGLGGVRWRGASLSRFDGRRWFNPPSKDTPIRVERGMLLLQRRPPWTPGRNIAYQVQLNDIASDTLFFAGLPETVSINLPLLLASSGGSLRVPGGSTGIGYSVYSFLVDETAPVAVKPDPLPPDIRQELLALPPLDSRIPQLARDMVAGTLHEEQQARAIEQRLRRSYGYTLELLPASVPDPLAHFLFVRRKGHCEYFASAMAVLLRSIGIPARVVTGFQSGVFNPMTGWQLIRASDAHSWVEAWIPERGWTTFDPTPPDPNAAPGGFLSRVSLVLDAAQQFWSDWVVGYDLNRQVTLATRVRESRQRASTTWLDSLNRWTKDAAAAGRAYAAPILASLAAAAAAIVYGPALLAWWRRRLRVLRAQRGHGQSSDATLLYTRMLGLLARRGIQKPPWLTPMEFARVLPRPASVGTVAPAGSDLARLVDELTAA
jgi:transglutaminase-like putative cysteine protease